MRMRQKKGIMRREKTKEKSLDDQVGGSNEENGKRIRDTWRTEK